MIGNRNEGTRRSLLKQEMEARKRYEIDTSVPLGDLSEIDSGFECDDAASGNTRTPTRFSAFIEYDDGMIAQMRNNGDGSGFTAIDPRNGHAVERFSATEALHLIPDNRIKFDSQRDKSAFMSDAIPMSMLEKQRLSSDFQEDASSKSNAVADGIVIILVGALIVGTAFAFRWFR